MSDKLKTIKLNTRFGSKDLAFIFDNKLQVATFEDFSDKDEVVKQLRKLADNIDESMS